MIEHKRAENCSTRAVHMHYTLMACLACFITVVLTLLVSYKVYGYAPFGNNSLASMDAEIQYLDFFAYFKDVLSGKNNISYTFGKTLGGTNIAVFSYYLASPLNLLVVFFEKTQLHTFFHLLVALKLGLAAATMHIFIRERWKDYPLNTTKRVITFLISICYGLCQYAIAQSSNVMWLDGVYLLPLILLGTYRVSKGESGRLLSVSVGLSILFNWYTGGINCLASVIWIFWELFLAREENNYNDLTWKSMSFRVVQYGFSMFFGICLSGFLFLPTVSALSKSSRGSLDWRLLTNFGFNGEIMSVIEGFSSGAISTSEKVSLFCGSLIVIGIVALFFEKRIRTPLKVLFGLFLAGTIILFYWNPAFLVFSLMKDASSYWFRYSYVGIFFLIFTASHYYLRYADRESKYPLLKAGAFCALLLLFASYAGNIDDLHRRNWIQCTAFFIVILSGVLMGCFCNNYRVTKRWRKLGNIALLSILVLAELSCNVKMQMNNYHVSDVELFQEYSAAAQKQIDEIKRTDSDFYRISQTTTRHVDSLGLTANYNEALAYGYWSISGYTSAPDDLPRTFLDRLGYRMNHDNMCIVNTSIISADSLLGVRYILSPDDISGYQQLSSESYNGKTLYRNPYALPMAFVYENSTLMIDANANTFEYQNQLYSQLIGEKIRIFNPVNFNCQFNEQGEPVYTLSVPKGNYALYGNLEWNSWFDGIVQVGNSYATKYACWLSPSVFYIPTGSDETEVTVSVTSDNTCDLKYGEEEFYVLDLNALAQISKSLNNKKAEYTFQNGSIHITAESDGNESLYISVPYDSGWKLEVDGEKAKINLFADCMYSIHLPAGQHEISMEYYIPCQNLGIAVSLFGLALIVVTGYFTRKK